MTDIHDLDRHIGRYVDLQEDGEGMAGFLIDVGDEVDYIPKPVRYVTLDYGFGMRVSADTALTFPEPPGDQQPPKVVSPVRAMHLAMHAGRPCVDEVNCAYEGRAVRALRAFREWRMRQSDAFWQHHFVREVRGYAQQGDMESVGEIMRDARDEGAPQHILDHLQIMADRAAKASREGS